LTSAVIWIAYSCLILGAGLLLASFAGRLTFHSERIRGVRALGLVAAAGPGLAPLGFWLANPTAVGWPFPVVAISYLAAFLVLAGGVVGPLSDRRQAGLRRLGYLGLLVLGALPSFVLLLLAPAVLLASLTLVEARPTVPVAA
jgi:hypothetical protein